MDGIVSANNDYITDPFLCESHAYRRLKAKGFCQRGVIPYFYRVIKEIDPTSCRPFLDKFMRDKLPPNGILMEYIPDLHRIDPSTYSRRRVVKLRAILDEIHEAKVYHGDAAPRNMMIQNNTDRVIWIDFGRSQPFSEATTTSNRLTAFTEQRQEMIEDERTDVHKFLELLKIDNNLGKISHTWSYYYDYL